jgi:hypothetical protein
MERMTENNGGVKKTHFLKEWRSSKKKIFFEIFGHEEKNGGYYVAQ